MIRKCVWLLCVLSLSLFAREEILDYAVEIRVNADTTLNIVEEITVRAERDEIKRGIYRDFPVKYDTDGFFSRKVGFSVVSVKRDGADEPYRVESQGRYQRVYIGDKDVLLKPGTYTYTLEYQTFRQLGFFDEQDELYYNAIGQQWSFPIQQAQVNITFPETFAGQELDVDVWTGEEGSKEKGAVIRRTGPRTVEARLSEPLEARQGMTVYVAWPKGLIQPPDPKAEFRRLMQEAFLYNPYVRVAAFGLLMSLATYFLLWLRHGRDPEKGVIIPRFAPPEGVSPAAARYLMQMGDDPTCFVSALLSLASKNWLKIHHPSGSAYDLVREEGEGKALSTEEEKIFRHLLGNRTFFEVKQENHSKLQKAQEALKTVLKSKYQGSHFHSNRKLLTPGILFTLLTLALFAWTARRTEVPFLLLWISIWTMGVIMLVKAVAAAWKSAFSGGGVGGMGQALFLTAFATPFMIGEGVAAGLIATRTSIPGMLLLFLQIPVILLFSKLLKQPTPKGRKLMDELEGLKMYLSTAEVERLHALHAPDLTPEHFDDMLPFALALDVEQKWAEAFEQKLASMKDARAGSYHPRYYTGLGFATSAGMCGALGRGLVSNVSSSSMAPGSSSGGGGGGRSGGGGGGGGGGGW